MPLTLYTRQETANLLGMSLDTLDKERRAGRIAYIQRTPRANVMFTDEGIAEYIARITHPAKPERSNITTLRKRRA